VWSQGNSPLRTRRKVKDLDIFKMRATFDKRYCPGASVFIKASKLESIAALGQCKPNARISARHFPLKIKRNLGKAKKVKYLTALVQG
jgi:hypothetical protein